MEVRTGYFVSFRGSGYGSYLSRSEARLKAMDLIAEDGNGYSAHIYEGIAFVANRRLVKGTQLSTVDTVTVQDCGTRRGHILH